MADSCLMHRSITVRCRNAMLNGANRPKQTFPDCLKYYLDRLDFQSKRRWTNSSVDSLPNQ